MTTSPISGSSSGESAPWLTTAAPVASSASSTSSATASSTTADSADSAVTLDLSPQAKAVMARAQAAQQAAALLDKSVHGKNAGKFDQGNLYQQVSALTGASSASQASASTTGAAQASNTSAPTAGGGSDATSGPTSPGWLDAFYQQEGPALAMSTTPGNLDPSQDPATFAEKLQNHTLTVTPASQVPGLDYKYTAVETATFGTESFSYNQGVAKKNPNTIIVGGPTGYMVNW